MRFFELKQGDILRYQDISRIVPIREKSDNHVVAYHLFMVGTEEPVILSIKEAEEIIAVLRNNLGMINKLST